MPRVSPIPATPNSSAAWPRWKQPVMMLAGPELRVVPVTVHLSLAEALGASTTRSHRHGRPRHIRGAGARFRLTRRAWRSPGSIRMPARVARWAARRSKLSRRRCVALARGTRFWAAAGRHDVSRGARGTLRRGPLHVSRPGADPSEDPRFRTGVNVTLGLPIVRTSPDHGTALDIAGHGVADPRSMIAAIEMAAEIAERRGL